MIGSLHSMSYLEKFNIWKFPFIFFRKTQKYNIEYQYEICKVKCFDLHISFVKKNGKAIFKYGNIEYYTFSVFEILNYLNKKEDTYVNFVLEEKGSIDAEKRFYEYCSIIEEIYKSIKFIGGYRESDKKQIYDFKNEKPEGLIFYRRVDKLNKQ